MFNKLCRWLDSNRRPLLSEATALPTEPHNHCPTLTSLLFKTKETLNVPFHLEFSAIKLAVIENQTKPVTLNHESFTLTTRPLLRLCYFVFELENQSQCHKHFFVILSQKAINYLFFPICVETYSKKMLHLQIHNLRICKV